jgi:hypothetical protein
MASASGITAQNAPNNQNFREPIVALSEELGTATASAMFPIATEAIACEKAEAIFEIKS